MLQNKDGELPGSGALLLQPDSLGWERAGAQLKAGIALWQGQSEILV